MTDTPRDSSEIAAYRLAVERHLADLPEPIREDLLGDLEAHLTEVASELEPGVDLADRLGTPEAYARELRETVEVEKGSIGAKLRRNLVGPLLGGVGKAADRFTTSAGVGEAAEFGRALRPAWWVLRGLIAASLLVYLLDLDGLGFVGLMFFGALAACFVWLSLRLGVRSREWGRRRRRLMAVAGAGLFGLGLLGLVVTAQTLLFQPPHEVVDYTGAEVDPYGRPVEEPYPGVTDVYPYDENGELLTGVYLFDQNGDPLYIGEPWACEEEHAPDPFEQDEQRIPDPFAGAEAPLDEGLYGYRYPICPSFEEQAEAATPDPDGEDATESAPDEPTEEATAESASPSPEPSENGS
jgi:hypothetical protein